MGLEIEFLDGPPTMLVGQTARLRVNQQDASGATTKIAISDVKFEFRPNTWGRVQPSSDPGMGVVEVLELVVSDDPLLEPSYAIEATLNKSGQQAIPPQRKIRLVPTALEIELALEVGVAGNFRRFALADLTQPIEWSKAGVTDPDTQSIVVRDGVPYLRLAGLEAFPAKVEITFPNGEVASLVVEGELKARGLRETARIPNPHLPTPGPTIEAPAAPTTPRPASPAAPSGSDTAVHKVIEVPPAAAQAPPPETPGPAAEALRDELAGLRRYVVSFSGRETDPEQDQRIQERIRQRVDAVRPKVDAYAGSDEEELRAQFEELCREALPAST